MADKPISISNALMRSLVEGQKTQFREVAHFIHPDGDDCWSMHKEGASHLLIPTSDVPALGPDYAPYAVGDRLWVRESFNVFQFSQDGENVWPVPISKLKEYREAEDKSFRYGTPKVIYRESDRARNWFSEQPWRTPVVMGRWASRFTLTVTEVRVERLQNISEADAKCEGLSYQSKDGLFKYGVADWDGLPGNRNGGWLWEYWHPDPIKVYARLWNITNGVDSWDANPWVMAIKFHLHRCNIDKMESAR